MGDPGVQPGAATPCGPGGQEPAARGLLIQDVRQRRGPHVVWTGPFRYVSAGRDLRRQDSQGREARRLACRAADQIRAGYQPQGSHGAWFDDSTFTPAARGRSDPMTTVPPNRYSDAPTK